MVSAAFLVVEILGVKKSEKSRKEPCWKRRVENNFKTWKKHLRKFFRSNLRSNFGKGIIYCEKDKKEVSRNSDLEVT